MEILSSWTGFNDITQPTFKLLIFCSCTFSQCKYRCCEHSWKPFGEIVFTAVVELASTIGALLKLFPLKTSLMHWSLTVHHIQYVECFCEWILQAPAEFDIRTFLFNRHFCFRRMNVTHWLAISGKTLHWGSTSSSPYLMSYVPLHLGRIVPLSCYAGWRY